MNSPKDQILTCDEQICQAIDACDPMGRTFVSRDILAQLRNLVEAVIAETYNVDNIQNLPFSYNNLHFGLAHCKAISKLNFLVEFHNFLEKSTSHYTAKEDNPDRLLLKYLVSLYRIKKLLHADYSIDVLHNLNKFPTNNDASLSSFYLSVSKGINHLAVDNQKCLTDRYYIQKSKPFLVDDELYYEVTLCPANDNISKFNRTIAFSRHEVLENYAIRATIQETNVLLLDEEVSISVMVDWSVSIRPCELANFFKIFGVNRIFSGDTNEYRSLMAYLRGKHTNLCALLSLPEEDYSHEKAEICKGIAVTAIFDYFKKVRKFLMSGDAGVNVIRYLLFTMNNRVIKQQYPWKPEAVFGSLYLAFGTLPFDTAPFCSNLIDHRPSVYDVGSCIDSSDREDELLARRVIENSNSLGRLYMGVDELDDFSDIPSLIAKFNSKVHDHQPERELELYCGRVFVKQNENTTVEILRLLSNYCQRPVLGYSSWASSKILPEVTDACKIDVLKNLYASSGVSLIYGAAGTGKTELIKYVAGMFPGLRKLFITQTYPALQNLRRRIFVSNSSFFTADSFLSRRNADVDFQVLIIDESSTIDNRRMLGILQKVHPRLILLVGDVYQIEAMDFGNWFSIAPSFLPSNSVFELTNQFRCTSGPELQDLWDSVRHLDPAIVEKLNSGGYCHPLDKTIFTPKSPDEIILCLNYDGIYGINNINRYLQAHNPNPPVKWGIWTYKVGDPILFNKSTRFSPIIYNNLKGKILKIQVFPLDHIDFVIQIEESITELDVETLNLQFLGYADDGVSSIVEFSVKPPKNSDFDDDDLSSEYVVPFQIAYAVSIHKAQGLEYDSVKIVVSKEVDERISHNIFYTAITRAKRLLNIYWSPEVETCVISKLKPMIDGGAKQVIKARYDGNFSRR